MSIFGAQFMYNGIVWMTVSILACSLTPSVCVCAWKKMRIIECVCSRWEYCFAAHLTITSTSVNIHCFSITHSLSPMSKNTHTHKRTYSYTDDARTHTPTYRHKRIARIKHKIHLFKIINISWERKEQENETRCRIKGVNLCLYIEIKPKYVCAKHSYLIAFFIRTRITSPAHTHFLL